MQAIRFGAFTPAQQAQLDALTGGKTLKKAVLDSFPEPEDKFFLRHTFKESTEELQMFVSRMTPQDFEEAVINEFVPDIQKSFPTGQQAANSVPDLRDQIYVAASVGSLVDIARRWKKPVTDKAFDALLQMVDSLKNTFKF